MKSKVTVDFPNGTTENFKLFAKKYAGVHFSGDFAAGVRASGIICGHEDDPEGMVIVLMHPGELGYGKAFSMGDYDLRDAESGKTITLSEDKWPADAEMWYYVDIRHPFILTEVENSSEHMKVKQPGQVPGKRIIPDWPHKCPKCFGKAVQLFSSIICEREERIGRPCINPNTPLSF